MRWRERWREVERERGKGRCGEGGVADREGGRKVEREVEREYWFASRFLRANATNIPKQYVLRDIYGGSKISMLRFFTFYCCGGVSLSQLEVLLVQPYVFVYAIYQFGIQGYECNFAFIQMLIPIIVSPRTELSYLCRSYRFHWQLEWICLHLHNFIIRYR